MNRLYLSTIVPGAVVTSEHDDDKGVWRVIAVDNTLAWIKNANDPKDRGQIRERPYMWTHGLK